MFCRTTVDSPSRSFSRLLADDSQASVNRFIMMKTTETESCSPRRNWSC